MRRLPRSLVSASGPSDADPGAKIDFPLMPLGEAADMGRAEDGTPLIDPRIFYSAEFRRNPWPYYRILRDHYPVYFNKLNNTYYVTRYADMTECYYDDIGFNTIVAFDGHSSHNHALPGRPLGFGQQRQQRRSR